MQNESNSKSEQRIAVVVIDDDDQVRSSCERVLQRSQDFFCAGSYATPDQALNEVVSANPEVVLMDICMPSVSGIECTRRLKEILPDVKVVMITGLIDANTLADSIYAGADGYLTKPFTGQQCVEALKFAISGGTPLSADIIHEMQNKFSQLSNGAEGESTLTEREREIMTHLADGLEEQAIGERLKISSFMVKKLIRQIYLKLNVDNRGDATDRWRKDNDVHKRNRLDT